MGAEARIPESHQKKRGGKNSVIATVKSIYFRIFIIAVIWYHLREEIHHPPLLSSSIHDSPTPAPPQAQVSSLAPSPPPTPARQYRTPNPPKSQSSPLSASPTMAPISHSRRVSPPGQQSTDTHHHSHHQCQTSGDSHSSSNSGTQSRCPPPPADKSTPADRPNQNLPHWTSHSIQVQEEDGGWSAQPGAPWVPLM